MKAIKDEFILQTYKRFDLALVRGKGAICYDDKGREFIDLTSGIGVNSLGFANKKWLKAVKKQASKLQHTSNLFYTKPADKLARTLCKRSGYGGVFFANSGAEANEGAIKIARKWAFDKVASEGQGEGYKGEKSTILVVKNSFHGRTVTTLSATAQESFHNYFFPFTQGFKEASFAEAKEAISEDVCAVMIEFIQGEGGVVAFEKEAMKQLYEECQKRGVLFIADEVQTGVGRTGRFLASEHYGFTPDITTLAKGLGGGLPIGAVLVSHKLKSVLKFGDHGSTFGGNPVVCAAAQAVLKSVDEELLCGVRRRGEIVRELLSGCKEVKSVSGMGLMLGIELASLNAREVATECINRGVLCLTAKEKVRLLPPLNISVKQLTKAVKILRGVLEGQNQI